MNRILLAVLLSMSPLSELRGGIPVALSTATSLSSAVNLAILCILANMLIILPLFLFLDFLHVEFMKIPMYRRAFDFFIRRIQKRSRRLETEVGRYGYFALAVFVAIPLPITGAWTGTIISWLLGLDRKKSILAIAIGVLIAGIIVAAVTIIGINALKTFT